jgi:hypothetical protein
MLAGAAPALLPAGAEGAAAGTAEGTGADATALAYEGPEVAVMVDVSFFVPFYISAMKRIWSGVWMWLDGGTCVDFGGMFYRTRLRPRDKSSSFPPNVLDKNRENKRRKQM